MRSTIAEHPANVLDLYRQVAELSQDELWVALPRAGGMSTALQVEGILHGALRPSFHDHDVIAHAIDERMVELGGNHPVPYAEDGEVAQGESRDRLRIGRSIRTPIWK